MNPAQLKPSATFVNHPTPPPAKKTRARPEAGTKKGRFCKQLPKEFRRDGFVYRQIARETNAAIYKQTWIGFGDPVVCYEVIRIRRRDGFNIEGRFVEPAEFYPNSQAWGWDGWTVQDAESAFRKLRGIVAECIQTEMEVE
jgi:hypothetical protein